MMTKRQELETITVRELRTILFNVIDQKMTIEELRAMLFKVDDQDKEYSIDMGMFHRIMADAGK